MNKVYLVDFKYYYITTKTKTKLEKWFKGKNEKQEITRIEQLEDDGLWIKDESPEAVKRLGVYHQVMQNLDYGEWSFGDLQRIDGEVYRLATFEEILKEYDKTEEPIIIGER